MNSSYKPLVAIVGRPNVGKSTLFNRIVGRRQAIVSDLAGTTRDRVATTTNWRGLEFILVDTGGLEEFPETEIWRKVRQQIQFALEDADVIMMVVDASSGITPGDTDAAQVLRETGKPLVLTVNKVDNEQRSVGTAEFYKLGLGDPAPISAFHNVGIDELLSQVVNEFPPQNLIQEPKTDFQMAIVGRTNVGKSMLLNSITEEDRAIVSDIPGTTRDSLDTVFQRGKHSATVIDTAGIRRRGKIENGLEQYSVLRSIRAIDRAEVSVLLMDASELATNQDSHIASYILNAYKGIVLAVNKWDLARESRLTRSLAVELIKTRFKFAPYAPICFISALKQTGIDKLLDTIQSVSSAWHQGLPRYDLRRTVLKAVAENPPSGSGRRSLKIFGVKQEETGPPSFIFYVNNVDMVHFGYRRYLENKIRQAYGFEGSPLKITFRGQGQK